MFVGDAGGTWDGSRESGGVENVVPPSKIVCGVTWCMMGNKGVLTKGSHEAFQIGKVGPASWENRAGA